MSLRRLLAALTVAAACVAPLACTAALGLDGFTSAADALCNKLDQCQPGKYPACSAHVSSGLDGADSGARASWLNALDNGCLDDCLKAEGCLDSLPVCHDAGNACGQDADCCGFTDLEAKCASGQCCRSDGVVCATDADCCSASCADDGTGTNTKRCGGVVCVQAGGSCDDTHHCCSLQCGDDHHCLAACHSQGATCATGSDCCSGLCPAGKCGCAADGLDCQSDQQCCTGVCTMGKCGKPNQCGALHSLCNANTCCVGYSCTMGLCCVQNGGNCQGSNANCCSGQCSLKLGTCCTPLLGACTTPGQQGTCCRGTCVGAGGQGHCCNQPICASPCFANPSPLTPCAMGVVDTTACVQAVCAVRPACCCTQWTPECAKLAVALKGAQCAGVCK